MNYKISFTQTRQDMDGVSVAKIKSYPLEREDYKPFAQFRMAATPEGLFLRMTAFEVSCEEHSALAFLLRSGGGCISAAAEHSGAVAALSADGSVKRLIHGEISARFFTGEDLQGIYWGADLAIPAELIPDFDGLVHNGGSGNFFKLCRTGRRHFGSFFPFDFSGLAASEAPDTPDETLRLLADGGDGLGDMPVVRF